MIGRLLEKSGGLDITFMGAAVIVHALIYGAEIHLHLGMPYFVAILQKPLIRCVRDPCGLLGAVAHHERINVTKPHASRLSVPSNRLEFLDSPVIIGQR